VVRRHVITSCEIISVLDTVTVRWTVVGCPKTTRGENYGHFNASKAMWRDWRPNFEHNSTVLERPPTPFLFSRGSYSLREEFSRGHAVLSVGEIQRCCFFRRVTARAGGQRPLPGTRLVFLPAITVASLSDYRGLLTVIC